MPLETETTVAAYQDISARLSSCMEDLRVQIQRHFDKDEKDRAAALSQIHSHLFEANQKVFDAWEKFLDVQFPAEGDTAPSERQEVTNLKGENNETDYHR